MLIQITKIVTFISLLVIVVILVLVATIIFLLKKNYYSTEYLKSSLFILPYLVEQYLYLLKKKLILNLEKMHILLLILVFNIFTLAYFKNTFDINNNFLYLVALAIPKLNYFIINFVYENKKELNSSNYKSLILERLKESFVLENVTINIINLLCYYIRNIITNYDFYDGGNIYHNPVLISIIIIVLFINRFSLNFLFNIVKRNMKK